MVRDYWVSPPKLGTLESVKTFYLKNKYIANEVLMSKIFFTYYYFEAVILQPLSPLLLL